MNVIGEALVAIRPDVSGFKAQADRSLSGALSGVGGTLTKTLTPAAGAIALAGRQAFQDWDAGFDAIRAGTGATGQDLEGLGDVMKSVAGRSTSSMGEIGQTVADLNTRLGLTGKPLEQLTQQFADLDRLNMPASVEHVSRAFGDWGVTTENQTGALDKLFRASQATGPSIDELSSLLVQYGAPLRQMGFGLDQATALLGKFSKEGVNSELVLGSLRIALGKMAREGVEDPAEALEILTSRIKAAGSAGEANKLALEAFGARAGPDMAAAIREGRFEIGALFEQIGGGTDTIEKAAKDTLDLGDKFGMLKNRVFGAIGPYGEWIQVVGGGAAAIGPALMGIGAMGPLLGKLGPMLGAATKGMIGLNVALLANPIGLVIVGLVALGIGLVVLWKKSDTFRAIVTGSFDAVKSAAVAVFDFFRGNWKTIATLISGPFAPLVALATDAFGIRSALVGAFQGIYRVAVRLGRQIVTGVLDGVKALPGKLKDALTGGLKRALGQLNPFSPVEHGGRRYIGEELVRGAVAGVRALADELGSALDEALQEAASGQRVRRLDVGRVQVHADVAAAGPVAGTTARVGQQALRSHALETVARLTEAAAQRDLQKVRLLREIRDTLRQVKADAQRPRAGGRLESPRAQHTVGRAAQERATGRSAGGFGFQPA